MTSEKLLYLLADLDTAWIEEAESAYQAGRLPAQKNYIKYLAVAATLAVLLLGASRPAILAKAAQAVVQWFEDHVSYHFREKTSQESVEQYGLQGLGEVYRLVDEEYTGTFGSAAYQSADQKETIYFLYGLSDGEIQIPGADMAYKLIVDESGTELHYVSSAGEGQGGSLTWLSEDGQTVFCVYGIQDEEKLLELRRHVWKTGNGLTMEASETVTKESGFDEILANLTPEQGYVIWRPESEQPILLVAEQGTYEIDGTNAAIFCQVYGLQDGRPAYLGFLASMGTAYPLMWDDEYIYVTGGHFWGRYKVSAENGMLRLSDGLSYVPAKESYSLRRDAEVAETFDENGEPDYISQGEWLDEESGEELMMQIIEASEKAQIIAFQR